MDELLAAIQARPACRPGQARGAAEAAMDFFRQKLPGGLGDKLDDLIAGNTDAIADAAGGLPGKVKDLFSR